MSPRIPASLLLLLALPACGPGAAPSGSFGLEVVMERAVADSLDSLQVAVLTGGSRRSCTELQSTCLNSQVARGDLVVLRDAASGREGRALSFPVDLQAAGSLELTVDVPVGRDYALVIEAVGAGSPPGFLGSSCNYLKVVNAGDNAPVIAAPLLLASKGCDPSIAP